MTERIKYHVEYEGERCSSVTWHHLSYAIKEAREAYKDYGWKLRLQRIRLQQEPSLPPLPPWRPDGPKVVVKNDHGRVVHRTRSFGEKEVYDIDWRQGGF